MICGQPWWTQRSTRSASGFSPDSAANPLGGQLIASAGPHITEAPAIMASAECGSTLSLNTASSDRAICSCWAYALGKAERCTLWAATVMGSSGQPGICFRPGMV